MAAASGRQRLISSDLSASQFIVGLTAIVAREKFPEIVNGSFERARQNGN